MKYISQFENMEENKDIKEKISAVHQNVFSQKKTKTKLAKLLSKAKKRRNNKKKDNGKDKVKFKHTFLIQK